MPDHTSAVHRRTVERAAELLGGREKLRLRLRVPLHKIDAWLAGAEPVPLMIFLKAVDLINTAATPAPVAAQRRVRDDSGSEFLDAALEAAIAVTRADRGNVQLAGADGLRIVASRGFERPFLDFFARVADHETACGRALKAGRRVVVSDVESDPAFAGGEARAAMALARVRAVQSTPIVAASGWILGVISTHYEQPREPSDNELASVDDIARRTAYWLESARA
jgi:hypothetical protein